MATHSSILAWKIPRTEEPGGLQSMDHKESDMTEQLNDDKNVTHSLAATEQYWLKLVLCQIPSPLPTMDR